MPNNQHEENSSISMCPVCGYVMSPFDAECERCRRRQNTNVIDQDIPQQESVPEPQTQNHISESTGLPIGCLAFLICLILFFTALNKIIGLIIVIPIFIYSLYLTVLQLLENQLSNETETETNEYVSDIQRNHVISGILGVILGGWGMHKFYNGSWGLGIYYLISGPLSLLFYIVLSIYYKVPSYYLIFIPMAIKIIIFDSWLKLSKYKMSVREYFLYDIFSDNIFNILIIYISYGITQKIAEGMSLEYATDAFLINVFNDNFILLKMISLNVLLVLLFAFFEGLYYIASPEYYERKYNRKPPHPWKW